MADVLTEAMVTIFNSFFWTFSVKVFQRWPLWWTPSTPLLIPGASSLSGWNRHFLSQLYKSLNICQNMKYLIRCCIHSFAKLWTRFACFFSCLLLLRLSMIALHKAEYCLFYTSLATFIDLVPLQNEVKCHYILPLLTGPIVHWKWPLQE